MSLPQNLTERERYIVSRWSYSIGKPVIDDAEYSVLDAAMKAKYPDDPYCNRPWSDDPCPTELLRDLGMSEYIMAVVLGDKTESIPSLNSEIELQQTLSNISMPATLSMKHDGWNIQCHYYNGDLVFIQTRGRSQDFMDVSSLKDTLPNKVPAKGKVKVVGELTISKSNFKLCKNLFSSVSPRSAVSSVLARPEYHYLLSFHAFDIHGIELDKKDKFATLTQWGFDVPMWLNVSDYHSLRNAMEFLSNEASMSYEYPADGVVYDGHMRRAIRLLYWEEPIYKSYVTGYSERFGPSRISPSVEIYPILRKGSQQKQLSMTNWARIIDYDLQVGSPIAFRVASDATADFDEESTKALHLQWQGRLDEYRQFVEANERLKKWEQSNG